MDLYTDIILDHYRHPRHYGELKKYSMRTQEDNPLCGDSLIVYLNIDRTGVIGAIGFQGGGCAISQAAMSMLAEALTGKSSATAKCFTVKRMLKLLEVPISPGRMKCATLGLVAIQRGLAKRSPVTKKK